MWGYRITVKNLVNINKNQSEEIVGEHQIYKWFVITKLQDQPMFEYKN